MSVGPISLPDLPPVPIEPAALAAEVGSLAQAVHLFLNNPPGDSVDPCALVQRIARLEPLVQNQTTDDVSRWLESLRELLESAR